MNRREFIGKTMVGAALVSPAAFAGMVSAVLTVKPERLPPAHEGMILTDATWNALVARVNELSERSR